MIKTQVEVTIKVDLEINKKKFIEENSDYFENAVPDENEQYKDEDIIAEAQQLFVQELSYEMNSTVEGVNVKRTEIIEYNE
jgi:hypothetical protein